MEKQLEIIIPAYNAFDTIRMTIMSIAYQSIADILKVTIVDDASTFEGSYEEIVKPFEQFLDINIIHREKNEGPGNCRQYAIDNSCCDYITFIDADDIFATPYALQQLYDKIVHDNLYLVSGNVQYYDTITHTNFIVFPAGSFVVCYASIYNRKFLIEKEINFKEDISHGHEDGYFNRCLRMLCPKDKMYFFKNGITIYYLQNNNTIEPNIVSNDSKKFCLIEGNINSCIYIYSKILLEDSVYTKEEYIENILKEIPSLYHNYCITYFNKEIIKDQFGEEYSYNIEILLNKYRNFWNLILRRYIDDLPIESIYKIARKEYNNFSQLPNKCPLGLREFCECLNSNDLYRLKILLY